MPFTIPPTANLGYSYMLSFKYKELERDDPLPLFWSRPQKDHLFLRVRLVYLNPSGREEEVKSVGHYSEDEIVHSMVARDPRVVNVRMEGIRIDTVYMEAVHFMAPQPGNYRFDVETVCDMPVFEPVISWLTVEREYQHHK